MKKIYHSTNNDLLLLPPQGEGAQRADGEIYSFFQNLLFPPSGLWPPSPRGGRSLKFLLLCIMIFFPLQLFATEDFYQFNSPTEQQRFTTLTSELRCLVCQNQNLAESNAPLAADLRQQVYLHMQQGQSDKVIIDYLVARYGNFILYRPPFNAATLGLWLAPFLFLFIGIFYLIFYILKKRRD